jgi:hypothetical protein
MSQPVFLSSPPNVPMNSYPPLQANVPRQFAQQPARASAPLSSSTAWAPQPAAPRPIIRAKGPDEPVPSVAMHPQVPAPLTMPTPEQLGVRSSSTSAKTDLDLTAAYRRLESLGAVCVRLDKLDTGDSRFTCLLPTRQAGVNHRVEADASSPAEAVRSVLTQAEDWAKTGK